jgi:hypothetical protein
MKSDECGASLPTTPPLMTSYEKLDGCYLGKERDSSGIHIHLVGIGWGRESRAAS